MSRTEKARQKTLDEVFEYLMSPGEKNSREVRDRREYALEVANSFGVSQEKLDDIACKFLHEHERKGVNLLSLFYLHGSYLVSIALLGTSKDVTERIIKVCAKNGFRSGVVKLTEMLGRDPTEEEVCQIVESDIRSGSRTYSPADNRSPSFITEAETNLIRWAEQYVSPEKIEELIEGYKNKDYDWKHDLL